MCLYERILQVPTYVTYDPYTPKLDVRCWQNGQYVLQGANGNGHYWIPELSLFLGIWHGERLGQVTHWLRWWDASGNLLLWSAEQAAQERQQTEQERQARLDAVSRLQLLGLTVTQIAEALSMPEAEVQSILQQG